MEIIIPKKQRVLSSFICKELLYEYIKDNLDSDRRVAVERALESDEDLKEDMAKIKEAMSYCHHLGQMSINEEFTNELMTSSENKSQNILKISWSILPERTKWAIEGASVAAIVVAFSIYLPWESFLNFIPKDQPIEISNIETELSKNKMEPKDNESEESKDPKQFMVSQAEPPKDPSEARSAGTELQTPALNSISGVNADLNAANGVKDSANTEASKGSIDTAKIDNQNSEMNVADESNEIPPKLKEKSNLDSNKIAQSDVQMNPSEPKDFTYSDVSQESSKVVPAGEVKAKPVLVGEKAALKGELYRAFMKLPAIDKNTAEFREKILSLGGQKAGEVQIGWRKPDGSYFHFSMEEAKLEELKQFMSAYGPVRFYKDPHWRVMPEGKIRIILWIEDSDLQK